MDLPFKDNPPDTAGYFYTRVNSPGPREYYLDQAVHGPFNEWHAANGAMPNVSPGFGMRNPEYISLEDGVLVINDTGNQYPQVVNVEPWPSLAPLFPNNTFSETAEYMVDFDMRIVSLSDNATPLTHRAIVDDGTRRVNVSWIKNASDQYMVALHAERIGNLAVSDPGTFDPRQFHDYRLEKRLTDRTPGSAKGIINLYADGQLLLSAPYENFGGASTNYLALGTGSSTGQGHSEWKSFRYNTGDNFLPDPEPPVVYKASAADPVLPDALARHPWLHEVRQNAPSPSYVDGALRLEVEGGGQYNRYYREEPGILLPDGTANNLVAEWSMRMSRYDGTRGARIVIDEGEGGRRVQAVITDTSIGLVPEGSGGGSALWTSLLDPTEWHNYRLIKNVGADTVDLFVNDMSMPLLSLDYSSYGFMGSATEIGFGWTYGAANGAVDFDYFRYRLGTTLIPPLYYDTSANTGLQGGNGTWNNEDALWSTGTAGTDPAQWMHGSDAVFHSTLDAGGTITVGENIIAHSVTIARGDLTLARSGSNQITLGDGGLAIVEGGDPGDVTIDAGVLTGTGGLTVDRAGTHRVHVDQSYTGQVQVLNGTLYADSLRNFGTDSSLGRGTPGTPIILGSEGNTGTIYARGTVHNNTNRTFELAAGGTGVLHAHHRQLNLYGAITGGSADSLMVFAVSGDQTSRNNIIRLNAQNTYQGATQIVGQAGDLGWTRLQDVHNALPVTTVLHLGGPEDHVGYLDLYGRNQELAGLVRATGSTVASERLSVYNSHSTLSTLTLNIAAGTTNAFDGTIGKTTPGAGGQVWQRGTNLALVKTGEGTLQLLGVNPYTGATAVNQGTLLVDGSLSGTSGVTVAAGATLGGSGTVAGHATILPDGIVSPGDSASAGGTPGTLNFANGLTLHDGAIWNWKFFNHSDGNYDKIVADGGSLILPSGGTVTLNIFGLDGYELRPGHSFTVFEGEYEHFAETTFDIVDHSGWSNIGDLYGWEVLEGSLILRAVPEPASGLMLVAGGVALLLATFRQRRPRD